MDPVKSSIRVSQGGPSGGPIGSVAGQVSQEEASSSVAKKPVGPEIAIRESQASQDIKNIMQMALKELANRGGYSALKSDPEWRDAERSKLPVIHARIISEVSDPAEKEALKRELLLFARMFGVGLSATFSTRLKGDVVSEKYVVIDKDNAEEFELSSLPSVEYNAEDMSGMREGSDSEQGGFVEKGNSGGMFSAEDNADDMRG